jgi:hypothetical protein
LEQLAKTAGSTPSEIAVRLDDIELAKPLYAPPSSPGAGHSALTVAAVTFSS